MDSMLSILRCAVFNGSSCDQPTPKIDETTLQKRRKRIYDPEFIGRDQSRRIYVIDLETSRAPPSLFTVLVSVVGIRIVGCMQLRSAPCIIQ